MYFVIVFTLMLCSETLSDGCNHCKTMQKKKMPSELELKHEVRFVLSAFVYGYRSPSEDEFSFLKNNIDKAKLGDVGLGTPTTEGNALSYKNGLLLYQQYADLAGDYGFIPGPVTIRCTDYDYTKTSALVAMTALTKMFETHGNKANFKVDPIMYIHHGRHRDDLLYFENCPKYKELQRIAYETTDEVTKNSMKEVCADLFYSISTYSRRPVATFEDIVTFAKLMSGLKALNMTPSWYDKDFDTKVMRCIQNIYYAEFTNHDLIRLSNGVALSELHNLMNLVMTNISKISIVPVSMYIVACHHRTVAAWLAGAGVQLEHVRNWIPKHGSMIVYTIVYYPSINEYGIKFYYNPEPEATDKFDELDVKGCDTMHFCKLTDFIKATKATVMSRLDYETECGFRTKSLTPKSTQVEANCKS